VIGSEEGVGDVEGLSFLVGRVSGNIFERIKGKIGREGGVFRAWRKW